MPRAKKKDFDAMARKFVANGCKGLGEAMIAGGYSRSTSQRGKASMSHTDRDRFNAAVEQHISKTLGKFEQLGKKVTATQQEDLVRGALISNVARGEDKSVGSLKMLGADKRVAMFSPEAPTGVFIITMPPHLAARVQPKAIDAPPRKDALTK